MYGKPWYIRVCFYQSQLLSLHFMTGRRYAKGRSNAISSPVAAPNVFGFKWLFIEWRVKVEFFLHTREKSCRNMRYTWNCLCKLDCICYLCLRRFNSEEGVRSLKMIIGVGVHQVVEIRNQLQNFVNWLSETFEWSPKFLDNRLNCTLETIRDPPWRVALRSPRGLFHNVSLTNRGSRVTTCENFVHVCQTTLCQVHR
jgi:hypothetical protein